MRRSFHSSAANSANFLLEPLEPRALFSVTVLTTAPRVRPMTFSPAVTASSTVAMGMNIHAEAGQSFRAVIGTLTSGVAVPNGYTLEGTIDWGDGTPSSRAELVRQADGSIAVLGSHTYDSAGSDQINIVVFAAPPAGTARPVLLIGKFQSTAQVIDPNGGVTLEETAGVGFGATLGFFHSNLSSLRMVAVINWGDGQESFGRILALPTAGLVPTFAVVGDHTYASIGSYPVHIAVYYISPTPVASTAAVFLVAQIDSVIDVLPPEPIATT